MFVFRRKLATSNAKSSVYQRPEMRKHENPSEGSPKLDLTPTPTRIGGFEQVEAPSTEPTEAACWPSFFLSPCAAQVEVALRDLELPDLVRL